MNAEWPVRESGYSMAMRESRRIMANAGKHAQKDECTKANAEGQSVKLTRKDERRKGY